VAWKQIPRAEEAPSYPLSSAQLRLWILYEINKDAIEYNIPRVLELNGSFDAVAYEHAIKAVVARHEILRTIFREKNGQARQWVLPAEDFPLRFACKDLRNEAAARAIADEMIRKDKSRPFDLENGPLFRVMLFRLEDEQYLCYYNMHHIISDGWSMNILMKEVMQLYEAFLQNADPQLPPLPIQYKDYAVWEQAELLTDAYRQHRTYWLEQLSGELPVLSLPSYKTRPPIMQHEGHQFSVLIGNDDVAKLSAVCQRRQCTLFMGLVSLMNTLFHRYTGQEDIIIGSAVAGREHADLADQIGFYINMLALRTRFSGSDSFTALLNRVREVTLAAYAHQQYPFDRLVQEMDIRRDMSRSAIFDVTMVLQNQQEKDNTVHAAGSEGQIIDEGESTAKYDLHIVFSERAEGINMAVQFNSTVYDTEIIHRFMKHFSRLLKLAATAPDTPLNKLEYMTAEEQHQLLHVFNDTANDFPRDKTIIDLFTIQVAATPDAVALISDGQSLTYRELDEKSNQLARYLLKKGVSHETLVPVCLDRSAEMIISILGILKAGGAFVPVDPSYPAERINYMLSDIDAQVIISHTFYRDLLDDYPRAFKLFVDRDWIAVEMEPEQAPDAALQPGQLAYVIYTSGSTGKPKGVLIEHKGVVNLALSQAAELRLEKGMGTLQFAPFSFDASCYEIFNTLLSGGYLVLPSREDIMSVDALAALISAHNISVAVLPPSFQLAIKDIIGRFKTVVSAGEPLNLEMAGILASQGVHLVNAYGPTESTVCASLSHHPVLEGNRTTIGGPLANTSLYVLDAAGGLVPVGITGELYIGGVQLARGYLKREDLTAARFIKHPYVQGERLYRTGDLARWLPDGNIEYMGRADDQVKIRGHRIELGEIEHALLEMEEVESAAVRIWKADDGGDYIAAYIVTAGTTGVAALKQQLRNRVPEYMMPSYIIKLEEMPLTVNGKIDRKALPSPAGIRLNEEAEYIAPENNVQEKLVEIIASVLGKQPGDIGIADNFFDIGANSLSLIKINSLINKSFNAGLKVSALFEYTNVRDLAENYFGDNLSCTSMLQENTLENAEVLNDAIELFEE
jgi:amino acid adenylation domain-containing protein